MSVIQNNLLLAGDDGYNLTRSLRFRSSASAYLSRTPASTTNQKTFTISMWVKRSNSGSNISLVSCRSGASPLFQYQFYSDNTLSVEGSSAQLRTTQVFRDFSAWYHLVLAIDTTQATSSDRIKMYVNGVQVTSFGTATYPSQNTNFNYNVNSATSIGSLKPFDNQYFDGYMAEIHSIDGQALTPSSFGEYSTQTGVWQAKKYSGTYGTNGFYLPFSNNSSTTTLGYDFSGNGNNWTTNNISLTSGSTYDSMVDVPTVGELASNYCVLNPLDQGGASSSSGANLQFNSTSSDVFAAMRGTFGVTSGKWYFEATPTTFGVGTPDKIVRIGVTNTSYNIDASGGDVVPSGGSAVWDSRDNGATSYLYLNGVSGNSYAYSFTVNDVVMVAFDADTGKIWFGKNGTWNTGSPSGGTGEAATLTSGYTYTPIADGSNSTVTQFNFGQRPFAYTPPTGFKALNTYNLPTPTIGALPSSQANKYFDINLWTGNGSARSITNSGFSPDLVWAKCRSTTYDHGLYDSVRGGNKVLLSNLTSAEITVTDGISAFDASGFSISGGNGTVNVNGQTYVGWQWRGSDSTAVTNTAGSITSTVSANTTSGFSVVTYTATSGTQTIGHGLGVAPSMIITKCRNAAGESWWTYHASLGYTKYLALNSTAASGTLSWGGAPTSSVFYNTSGAFMTNGNTYVAYCFAEVAGFSKFGSYTGNGSSDGTFVYTGFRPRYVMIKKTSAISNWWILDTARDTYNVADRYLYAESSDAEDTRFLYDFVDILSNGFKLRSSNSTNTSSATFIYMAFAENPFKYSLAR